MELHGIFHFQHFEEYDTAQGYRIPENQKVPGIEELKEKDNKNWHFVTDIAKVGFPSHKSIKGSALELQIIRQ